MSGPNLKDTTTDAKEVTDDQRQHLSADVLEQVKIDNQTALELKEEFRQILDHDKHGGEEPKEFHKMLSIGAKYEAKLTRGRYYKELNNPLFNLDIPAEERYNILMLNHVISAGEGYANLKMKDINDWVFSSNHKTDKKLSHEELTSGLNLYFTSSVAYGVGNQKGQWHWGRLGQILPDFQKRYPELLENLTKGEKERDEANEQIIESIRDQLQEAFKKGDYSNTIYPAAREQYWQNNPNSAWARYADALAKTYNILRNEYGLTDVVLLTQRTYETIK